MLLLGLLDQELSESSSDESLRVLIRRTGADEVLLDEDSGHDCLMDPGCRAVGRPPCTRPGLGLSSPEGTTVADVSPQQREPRHS